MRVKAALAGRGAGLGRLAARIGAVQAAPALARFQFRAGNHWTGGGHRRTTIKGFYGAGQEDATRGIALDDLERALQGDLDLRGFPGPDSGIRPGHEQIRVTIKVAGAFDDDQLAELASLTRYSPVRDIASNPVPVATDVTRA